MKRIIAVRMFENADGRFLAGYTARQKNQRRVWLVDITGKSKDEIQAEVDKAEQTRALAAQP